MIISGCLPFIVTNSNIMSKVQESFKTGKFRPGIEFSICSNQFHLPWKTAAKGWNWYQRWPWRNRTHISVWKIPTGKTGLPFQTYRCFLKFSTETTRKVVFHLLSNWISQKLFVNGKQSQFPSAINSNVMIRLFRMCGVPWSPLITWIIIFSELYHQSKQQLYHYTHWGPWTLSVLDVWSCLIESIQLHI